MTITGPIELQYAGWGAEEGRALLWIDLDARAAAVLDSPDNPGTSVTNAVEQVIEVLRSEHGEDLRVFTIGVDPISDTATFEVELDEGGAPSWAPVLDGDDAPEVVRRAQQHAVQLQGDEGLRDDAGEPGLRADQPISTAADDRLERADFARAIAEDVRQAPRESGFVIAVTGEWGEGKTSLINMVAGFLRETNEAEIVYFNPWLFSGTEQLVEHFFDELTGQLRETGLRRLTQVGSALERYGRIVRPLRVLPVVGNALAMSGEVAAEASQALGADTPSARARAAELQTRLQELKRPILVVVDDLDRLRADEIVDVMRLVRVVGDFPNLVYLLAFDRPRVEQALGEGDPQRGRAYVEKLVQITHALPRVREQTLTALLVEDLSAAVGDTSAYQFDREHFENLFWGGARQLFSTVRDVRRFTNVLPATLALLGDEVELADILTLEAIRVFLPDTFLEIAAHPEAFTTTTSNLGLGREGRDDEHAKIIERAIEAAGDTRAPIRHLVPELFPAASRHLGGSHYGPDWLDTWRRQRRVAHADVLGIYLRKRLPPGTVSASQTEAIFDALEDEERLDQLLSDLDESQLEEVLSRLQGYEEDFPGTQPQVTISVLSRHGNRLRRGMRHMHDFGADVELGRVFYRLLRGLDAARIEAAVDAAVFADYSSHYAVVRIVGHREGSGHRLVDEAVGARLEKELAEKLLTASAGDLWREPDLGPLVFFLLEQRPDDAARAIRHWVARDRFFVAFLRAHLMVSLGSTVGKAAVRRTLQLNWPALSRSMGEDVLVERSRQIDRGWVLEEFDEDAAEALKQAQYYAEHPESAERDVRRWPSYRADGDEDE